ncbi:MAG: hypothetical protein AB1458_16770, partial [Bacteroidota bacterium]
MTFGRKVRLLAFVSARGFFLNRRRIKNDYPGAMVLPMYPGLGNWKKNLFILYLVSLFIKERNIIARGVFAYYLANRLKRMKRAD